MARIRFSHFLIIQLLLVSAWGVSCDSLTGSDDDNSSENVELFPVRVAGSWGYIDREGRVMIEPQFQNAAPFFEGLAAVRQNWGWKYIDASGEVVIEGSYQNIQRFSEDRAAVQMEGRWGFINRQGDFIINPKFRGAYPFSSGLAFVRSLDFSDYLYIDGNGNPLESVNLPEDIDFVEDNLFTNQRALVRDDEQFGYIDPEGNTIVDLIYSEAHAFSEEKAAVRVSDRWGFINPMGEVTIQPQFISVGDFGNGLAPARRNTNLFGFIDETGNFVINEQFLQVRPFSEERAPVFINNKWTFIDLTGNTIVEPIFDEVEPFRNGLARVTTFIIDGEDVEEQYGYINTSGDYVWFPTR
ncbi:MAG: WG repeat-containing protein [Bacteroidota bacterium]